MILPEVRDPRMVTIRRGGTLTDADHRRLALWAAACAEHVLHLFEDEQGSDPRPREAVEAARRIAPRRTFFTHMCHDLPHAETNAALPEGMALAYDGLELECR